MAVPRVSVKFVPSVCEIFPFVSIMLPEPEVEFTGAVMLFPERSVSDVTWL